MWTMFTTSYLLPATKLGQGNVLTGICDSVNRGGGFCLSACWDTTPPRSRRPPEADTPWEQMPPKRRPPLEADPPEQTCPTLEQTPPAQSMLGDTVNARAVRILLECKLVQFCFLTDKTFLHFCLRGKLKKAKKNELTNSLDLINQIKVQNMVPDSSFRGRYMS